MTKFSLSTAKTLKNMHNSKAGIRVEGDLLKRYQNVLLMMLKDIDKVCQENNISYTLGGGSCLGAVRHNGFIPWDDDIDINMTREDYKRFKNVFPIIGDKYYLQDCWSDKNCDVDVARVRLKGTVARVHGDSSEGESGVFIDVFLLENVPNSIILRFFHGFGSLVLGFVSSCCRFDEKKDAYLKMAEGDEAATKSFKTKIRIGKVFSFRTANAWTRSWDKWNGRCNNENSKYMTFPAGRNHYFGEMHPRGVFLPPKEATFEGISVPIVCDYDTYFSSLYGSDYMSLPPEDKRETHVVLELDLGEYE